MLQDAARALRDQLAKHFGLHDVVLLDLHTLVNDVYKVSVSDKVYALKLYNVRTRNAMDVRWEVDLVHHLIQHGAPVVRPVSGTDGDVVSFSVAGQDRVGVLFEWAPGERPARDHHTYTLLGRAAAQIHQAADTFTTSLPRDAYDYDATVLIDEQLRRMQQHLVEAKRWDPALALGDRLKAHLANSALDRGICHMDLTRANVYLDGERLTVFDFDSAGRCWRAIEPFGVLKVSRALFADWLEGYRVVRPFSADDERAVAVFGIVADLRIVAWKLGVAASSRRAPLMTVAELPGVVDEWLAWEREYVVNGP
jgi:Ser/Thr protein kinase RdoA (MazF antagonist)